MWSWSLPRWLGRVGLCHKLPVPSCGDASRVEAFGERPRSDAPCGQRLCDVEANVFEVAHRHDVLIRYDNAGFHFHEKKTLHLSICSRHFIAQSKKIKLCSMRTLKKVYLCRHFSLLGTCWLARRIHLHLHNATLLVNILMS